MPRAALEITSSQSVDLPLSIRILAVAKGELSPPICLKELPDIFRWPQIYTDIQTYLRQDRSQSSTDIQAIYRLIFSVYAKGRFSVTSPAKSDWTADL